VARGTGARHELYIQITASRCRSISRWRAPTRSTSHPAFDPIKAYDRDKLKAVFRDASFR